MFFQFFYKKKNLWISLGHHPNKAGLWSWPNVKNNRNYNALKLNNLYAFYQRARLSRNESVLAGASAKKKTAPRHNPVSSSWKNIHQILSFDTQNCLFIHTQELTHIPKVRIQFAEFLYLHFPILLEPWRLRSPDAVRYGFFFWKHLS